uniref:Trace amine associated receptor 8 n=1 Tax=Mandrillus leucophaeus TaxID=9568 RepID=A0A2K5Z1M5_MANLE
VTSNFSQPVVQLCYEDVNGSCIKTPYSPRSWVILYTAFSFGFGSLLAVFGNLLVMTSVLHFKQLQSPTNFLIASLACADFLVGVTVIPFSMYFGAKFCTLHSCCDVAFCYSSVLHLCFICIDRCIAIPDPLVYPTKFTMSVLGICVSVSWILPRMYSGAVFYTGANDDGLEELVSALNCVGGCQIVVSQGWVLIDFLLFFIPTLVMIIIYSKIFLIAKQQAIKIETTSSKSYKIRVAEREESIMNPLIYALFYPWFRKAIKLILSRDILKASSSTISLFSE